MQSSLGSRKRKTCTTLEMKRKFSRDLQLFMAVQKVSSGARNIHTRIASINFGAGHSVSSTLLKTSSIWSHSVYSLAQLLYFNIQSIPSTSSRAAKYERNGIVLNFSVGVDEARYLSCFTRPSSFAHDWSASVVKLETQHWSIMSDSRARQALQTRRAHLTSNGCVNLDSTARPKLSFNCSLNQGLCIVFLI